MRTEISGVGSEEGVHADTVVQELYEGMEDASVEGMNEIQKEDGVCAIPRLEECVLQQDWIMYVPPHLPHIQERADGLFLTFHWTPVKFRELVA